MSLGDGGNATLGFNSGVGERGPGVWCGVAGGPQKAARPLAWRQVAHS